MSTTTPIPTEWDKSVGRNPTMFARCGCPYNPVYDEDSLGWHLLENHPDLAYIDVKNRVTYSHGNVWFSCVEGSASEHHFTVNEYFTPKLTEPVHMLTCDRCGVHLHARFDVQAECQL